MSKALIAKRTYPWNTTLVDKQVTFRLQERKDLEAFLRFARALPENDLLFLSFDITDRAAMEQRMQNIENNKVVTVLAEVEGEFVGYASLTYNQLQWTRHLGEIRVMVSPEMRGHDLGRMLVNEVFLIAQELNLRKLIVRMTIEQQRAVKIFEHLGFKPEALLADHVIDRKGQTHDLILMSHDVTGLNK